MFIDIKTSGKQKFMFNLNYICSLSKNSLIDPKLVEYRVYIQLNNMEHLDQ